MTVGGQMTPDTAMAAMSRKRLQTIGIDADAKEAERGLPGGPIAAPPPKANSYHLTVSWPCRNRSC